MDDFFIVFYIIWLALVSTVLFLLIERLPSSRFKIVLPLICGIVIFFFTMMFDIYYGPLFLLKILFWPLLLPSFVIASVPFIEKKEGMVFKKFFVFSGALTALILYSCLTQIAFPIGEKALYGEYILWDVGLLIISGLVFSGMSRYQRFDSRSSKEDQGKTEIISDNPSSVIDMNGTILIAAFLLLLISPYFLLSLIGSLY